jgi:Xaa-Pro aminopeptidase
MTNVERLRAALAEKDLPAVVISGMPAIYWLTGFTGSFGMAIVTATGGVFLTDSRYTLQAREQCTDLPTDSFRNPTKAEEFLKEHVEKLGLQKLAYDHNSVTVGLLAKWSKQMTDVELVPVDDPIDDLRMIKSPQEVEKLRTVCRLADASIEHLLARVKPGVSERELLWALEDFLRPHGATLAFAPIIASGPNSARPHGSPGERCIELGDFITFDLGARIDGYNSDITRTVVVGKASERQREVYEHLLKAQLACIAAMKPGAKGTEVDALARQILDEKELGQYFGHGLGHGLGALVHDTGRLSPVIDFEIKAGQVWTIEPGVYIEGFGGMRIEDDILITDSGCEVLTSFPKELIEIPC